MYFGEVPLHLVAIGRLCPWGSTMHTMQMPNYLARLVIEEIRDAIALIPVPIEEVQLVIETLETFVSWPKQLVKAISTKDQVFFFLQ